MAETFITDLCERVREAGSRKAALRVRGGGTKDFYGEAPSGEILDVAPYSGIVAYEPKELVLTVRAGTPLSEVERVLGSERQMLAFEPPRFGPGSTIGGVVAAGLSGPRRPYAGSLRDFVLGTRFHGCLIGLLAGVPSFVFVHDARTREMCELLRIPHLDVRHVGEINVRAIYDSLDLEALQSAYSRLYQNYVDFLDENGLDHCLNR